MYFDPLMIFLMFVLYCVMAVLSFASGRKHGVIMGVDKTLEFLEEHQIIKFDQNGTLQMPSFKKPTKFSR